MKKLQMNELRENLGRYARLASACLIALLLAACGSGGGSSGGSLHPAGPALPRSLTTSIELAPAAPGAEADLVATFGYAITPSTVALGAYVAEIHFNPSLVQFVSPDPNASSGRLLNTLQAASGSIIVGGASTGGFVDGLLYKGAFRKLAPNVAASDFRLTLREATDSRLGNLL